MNRIMRFWFNPLLAGLLIAVLALTGCGGSDGAAGAPGADGADGADGAPGLPGDPGGNVQVTNFHGTEYLLSTGEFVQPDPGKVFVTVTVTGATANATGVATVNFTVEDDGGNPVVGVTGVDFSIAQLVPPTGTESANKWVSYIYRTETPESATGRIRGGPTWSRPIVKVTAPSRTMAMGRIHTHLRPTSPMSSNRSVIHRSPTIAASPTVSRS